MKIILLKDVAALGQAGDVCEVKSGYGLNFLIPQKLAQIADKNLIHQAQQQKEIARARQKKQEKQLNKSAQALKNIKIAIKAKTNEKGKLFGAVSAGEIAQSLQKDLGFEISAKNIKIETPIKEVGQWTVELDLGNKVMAKIKVEVVAD